MPQYPLISENQGNPRSILPVGNHLPKGTKKVAAPQNELRNGLPHTHFNLQSAVGAEKVFFPNWNVCLPNFDFENFCV